MINIFHEKGEETAEQYAKFLINSKKTRAWVPLVNNYENPQNLSLRQHEILTGLIMNADNNTLINLDPFGYVRKMVIKYLIDGYPADDEIFVKEVRDLIEELKKAALTVNYHKVENHLRKQIENI